MSALGKLKSKSWWKFVVALLVAAVAVGLPAGFIAFSLLQTSDSNAVIEDCNEPKAKRAAPNEDGERQSRRPRPPPLNLIELQSNRARPSMVIPLADTQSHVDWIAFSSKGRKRVPDNPRARMSAVLTEAPRKEATERFDGEVGARADRLAGATIAVLKVCVARGEKLRAGAFQATARIYGPRVADFDYAVIVTEKWPWYIAAGVLWYAGLLFVVAAWWTRSLTFSRSDPPTHGMGKYLASAVGLVIGFAAMVPTFFGTYWNNATWGSDPGTQLAGLATAGLTAAFAGLAAAHKLLENGPEILVAKDAAQKALPPGGQQPPEPRPGGNPPPEPEPGDEQPPKS